MATIFNYEVSSIDLEFFFGNLMTVDYEKFFCRINSFDDWMQS